MAVASPPADLWEAGYCLPQAAKAREPGYAQEMVTAPLPRNQVDEIAARASEVRLGRLLLTFFLGVFYAIGWIAGQLMNGMIMGALAVRRGWLDSRGVTEPQHALRRPAPA
jgi:hypothetical protein